MRARIRPLEPGDVEVIVEIVRGLPEWFTPEAVEAVGRDAHRLAGFVAELEGSPKGFILLEERECCMEIAWLAVEKGSQGLGLGTLLLQEAEQYACNAGKPILTVKTYGGEDYEPYNRTMRFYRSRGFLLYEVVEGYKPFGGQPAAILVKPVKCSP